MQESLTVNLELSKDDYVRVLRRMHSESFFVRHGPHVTFAVLFVGILGLILFLSFDTQQLFLPMALLAAFIPAAVAAGAVYILDNLISFPLLKRSIARQVKSSPVLNEVYTVTFHDEGISTLTSLTTGTVKWDGFIRAVETENDFLFYTSNKFSQFVPKEAFLSETDVNFVRCLARAKLADRAEF